DPSCLCKFSCIGKMAMALPRQPNGGRPRRLALVDDRRATTWVSSIGIRCVGLAPSRRRDTLLLNKRTPIRGRHLMAQNVIECVGVSKRYILGQHASGSQTLREAMTAVLRR